MKCVAWGCTNRTEAGQGKTFHRFPRDLERQKEWIKALNREGFQLGNNSRLCGDHFDDSCFHRTGKGNLRLKEDAIPTVFTFPSHLHKKCSPQKSLPPEKVKRVGSRKVAARSLGPVNITYIQTQKPAASGPAPVVSLLHTEAVRRGRESGSSPHMSLEQSSGEVGVQKGGSGKRPGAEGQQQFESSFIQSPAYQHWKRLGAQQGLCEDSEIACFLLKYYENTSKVLPSELAGVCKACGTPLSISCTHCDWTVCGGLPSQHEMSSGSDVAVKEEANDDCYNDNGEDDHDHPSNSLDILSTSHLMGVVENEVEIGPGEGGPGEGDGEVTGGARGQRSCNPEHMGLQWSTDDPEDCQETVEPDSRNPTRDRGQGLSATIKDERDFPFEHFMDVKPDISGDTHKLKNGNSDSRDVPEENLEDENCMTFFQDDPDDDGTLDIVEKSQGVVKSKEKPEDNAEDSEEQRGCVYDPGRMGVSDDMEADSDTEFQCNSQASNICQEPQKDLRSTTQKKSDERAAYGDAETAAELKVEMFEPGEDLKEKEGAVFDESKIWRRGDAGDPGRGLLSEQAEQTVVLDNNQPAWRYVSDLGKESVVGEMSAFDSMDYSPLYSQSYVRERRGVALNLKSQSCFSEDVADEAGVTSARDDGQFVRSSLTNHANDRAAPPGGSRSQSVQRGLQHHVSEETTEASVADAAEPSHQWLPQDEVGEKPEIADMEPGLRCLLDHSYPALSSAINRVVRMSRPSASKKPVKTTSEKSLQCDVCSKSFDKSKALRSHKLIHHIGQFTCDLCGKVFPVAYYLRKHKKSCYVTDNPVKCDECGAIFKTESALRSHKKVHSDHKSYVCDTCGRAFKWKNNLKQHSMIHADQKQFLCDVCGKSYSCRNSLRSHKEGHKILSCKKPYICETCGCAFSQSSNLRRHKVAFHNFNGKPFVCTMCTESFRTAASLKIHKVTAHKVTGLKLPTCLTCGKIFRFPAELKKHMRVHTRERTGKGKNRPEHLQGPPYPCDTCGRKFSLYANLKRHRVTHTGEKPYQCDVCHKNFTTASSVKTHKLTHTGVRPFECDICQKTFTEKGTLKKHKKIHARLTSTCDP